MNTNEDKIDVDPDYARNNTALRNIIKTEDEEEANVSSDKVYTIIAEEFDKELNSRQTQLEEIEEKIAKAQKLLHILRYVLITSYYNKNLEHNVKESEADPGTLGAQNRIHPAIKKLLGKNGNLSVFSNLGKRKAVQKNCDSNEASPSQGSSSKKMKQEPKLAKSKVQGVSANQNCVKNRKKTQHRIIIGNISKYMPSIDNDNTTHKWMVYVRGEKDKGDISHIVERVKFYLHPSYKPHDVVEICEPPFHLSRRGWGEFPLRAQIVFKCKLNKPVEVVHNLKLDKTCSGRQVLGNETLVDVFLHSDQLQVPYAEPSTSQNIKEEPAETLTIDHDSLHEEIFIKTEPDDEMELLLSKTEQFLDTSYNSWDLGFGNESTASTSHNKNSLHYDPFKKPHDVNIDRRKSNQNFEGKPVFFNQDSKQTRWFLSDHSDVNPEKPGLDHDYCQEEMRGEPINSFPDFVIKEEPLSPSDTSVDYIFNNEHSYCIPVDDSGEASVIRFQPTGENVCDNSQNDENKLRFGLDDSYFDHSISENKDQSPRKSHSLILNKPIKILLQTNHQTVLTNGHLVNLSPKPTTLKYSLVPQVGSSSTKSTNNSYRIPQNKFRNMGEVLPYLMKRFPLWNEQAKDSSYKRTFPYVATSRKEYESWNIGKRVNAEWNRAKFVKKILSSESIPDVQNWTVKAYFMYSRSHLYSPPVGFSIFKKHTIEVSLLNSCFANTFSQGNSKRNIITLDEETVDIESEQVDHPNSNLKTGIIDISDPSMKLHCSYIKETALDSGIVLKSEEIIEGVIFNGAERMILEAVKCFAEGLIRRAHHYAVCSDKYRPNNTEISTTDLKLALNERSDFKSLEEFRRKRQTKFYFS